MGGQIVALGYRYPDFPVFFPNEVEPITPSVSIVPEKLNRIPFMSCLFSIVLFFLEDRGKVISEGDSSQGRNGHIIVLNFGFVNFDCFCVCFTLPLYFVK